MRINAAVKHCMKLQKLNSGFTLIELLVTLIIIGVLSTIALPTFLDQIGRARGSEAKSTLGGTIRSQKVYYFENGRMATAITQLDVKLSGKFYTYAITNATSEYAQVTATASGIQTSIKHYLATIQKNDIPPPDPPFFGSVICEGRINAVTPTTATPPLAAGESGSCGTDIKVE